MASLLKIKRSGHTRPQFPHRTVNRNQVMAVSLGQDIHFAVCHTSFCPSLCVSASWSALFTHLETPPAPSLAPCQACCTPPSRHRIFLSSGLPFPTRACSCGFPPLRFPSHPQSLLEGPKRWEKDVSLFSRKGAKGKLRLACHMVAAARGRIRTRMGAQASWEWQVLHCSQQTTFQRLLCIRQFR